MGIAQIPDDPKPLTEWVEDNDGTAYRFEDGGFGCRRCVSDMEDTADGIDTLIDYMEMPRCPVKSPVTVELLKRTRRILRERRKRGFAPDSSECDICGERLR